MGEKIEEIDGVREGERDRQGDLWARERGRKIYGLLNEGEREMKDNKL